MTQPTVPDQAPYGSVESYVEELREVNAKGWELYPFAFGYVCSLAAGAGLTARERLRRIANFDAAMKRVSKEISARLQADAEDAREALTYSREQDDPTPVSPARGGPVHTGGVVAGGELVDETPAEDERCETCGESLREIRSGTLGHIPGEACAPVEGDPSTFTAAIHFSEAYREAFRLARQTDPGHRSSPELRTAAALDLLHGQAFAEDAERARRADVREGEQGRVTSLGVAYFLAAKEEKRRTARHFLGLKESAKHHPVDETETAAPVLTPAGLTVEADLSRGPLAGTSPVVTYFSVGHDYVTVAAPTYDGCREAMFAKYGNRWGLSYLAGMQRATDVVRGKFEREVIVAPGTDQELAKSALKAAGDLLYGFEAS